MFIFRLRSIHHELVNFTNLFRLSRTNKRKLNKICLHSASIPYRYCFTSPESVSKKADHGNKKETFDEMLERRRTEAKQSYLVQVYSEQSCGELFEYCNKLAPIKSMFHYFVNKSNHFVLIELKNPDLEQVLDRARFMEESESVPVFSNMLWFKATKTKKKSLNTSTEIPLTYAVKGLLENELLELLNSAVNVSDQIHLLYETTKLDEIGTRLRFFTASQIERSISGLFPKSRILPFGSSVNGCGKMGCDLDLVLQLSSKQKFAGESRLVFQGKAFGSGTRASSQRQMELIADILHVFLPGASTVRRILQARVPIVKYSCDFTGVECDLSLALMSGVYMSELLHMLGSLDERFQPLVFAVKKWAAAASLTSHSPGRWITNFSLTTLVIFYFQTLRLLPSIDLLVRLARPEDKRFETDVVCTFLRQPDLVPAVSEKNSALKLNLELLLKGFYEFYASFDFDTCAVNIYSGSVTAKPDHSPLYLVNPLERGLNISRNVSGDEVGKLRMACRNAVWMLENNHSFVPLITPSKSHIHPADPVVHPRRIVRVKDLFAEGT